MNRPEQEQIHRPVVAHLRARASPGLVWWHTPNGAYYGGRNAHYRSTQGRIMKALGVRAGVSDIVGLYRGKFGALELKAYGKYLTPAQRQFLDEINEAGGNSVCSCSLEGAIQILEDWGWLKGTMT